MAPDAHVVGFTAEPPPLSNETTRAGLVVAWTDAAPPVTCEFDASTWK